VRFSKLGIIQAAFFIYVGAGASVFGQLSIIPAKLTLDSLITYSNQTPDLYLSEIETEAHQKIIKITISEPTASTIELNSIYSVDFECSIQAQLSKSKLAPSQHRNTQSQIVQLDEEVIPDNSLQKNTSDSIILKNSPLKYKSYLSIHFTSEKKRCQIDANTMLSCINWDNKQAPPHFKNTIAEFESIQSPAEAADQCFRYKAELYQKLAHSPQKFKVTPTLMDDLSTQLSKKMTKIDEPAVPIGFSVRYFSKEKQNPAVDFNINCRVSRDSKILPGSTNSMTTNSLGFVHLIFSTDRKTFEAVNFNFLGNIRRIKTEAGQDGAVPYIDTDEYSSVLNPNIETRIYQYYSPNYPVTATNIKNIDNKVSFPFAIDELVYNNTAKILTRSIFDFKRNHIWQEEFSNLEFENLTELIASEFWIKNQNNWFDLTNNQHIKPNPVRLEDCSQ
jgi:hypothetical protein